MARILILGPQGAGKTTMTEELRKEGYDAEDADNLQRFAHWFDLKGEEVKAPDHPTIEWYDVHKLVWSKAELMEFVKDRPNIVLFNVVNESLFGLLDVFDRLYYLSVKPELWWERLARRQPDVYGKMDDRNRQAMLDHFAMLEEKVKRHSIELIDASGTSSEVLDNVKKAIGINAVT